MNRLADYSIRADNRMKNYVMVGSNKLTLEKSI